MWGGAIASYSCSCMQRFLEFTQDNKNMPWFNVSWTCWRPRNYIIYLGRIRSFVMLWEMRWPRIIYIFFGIWEFKNVTTIQGGGELYQFKKSRTKIKSHYILQFSTEYQIIEHKKYNIGILLKNSNLISLVFSSIHVIWKYDFWISFSWFS